MKRSEPAFSRIVACLQDVEGRLECLLGGSKLYLDPTIAYDALWIEQIHAFYPDSYEKSYDRNLDSKPEMYYITPAQQDLGLEPLLRQTDTSVHPLHTNLMLANEQFLRGCSYSGVRNVAVAGADPHFRQRENFERLFARTNNLYLHPKGDLVSLAQTARALRKTLEGEFSSAHAVFIDNSSNRFAPFLKMVDLFYEEGVTWLNEKMRESGLKGRVVVNEVAKAGIARVKALGYRPDKALSPLPTLYKHIFFDTSSEEKEDDVQRTVERERLDLALAHSNALLGHSQHAPELTYSFGGNALDKLRSTLKDKLAEPQLDDELSQLGLTRKTAFIMVADGGESVADERLRTTYALKPVLHLSHPFSEFPGSETKPIAQRHGAKEDGYHKIWQAYSELHESRDYRFIDNCVILIAPLEQADLDNPVYFAYKNKAKMEYVFTPRPDYHLHKTQRHFQQPEGMPKTLAEMEEDGDRWMSEGLAIAGALRLAARAGHVQKLPLTLKRDFDAVKDVEVFCPWPLPPDSPLPGQLAKHHLRVKGCDQPMTSFDQVRRTIRNSSAFFFPNVPVTPGENFWMTRIFLPSSIYVAKQLRDPYVNGHPMVTYAQPGEDRPEVEVIFDHLKRAAMVSQDPHRMYNRAQKPESAARFIKNMSVMHIPISEHESNPYTPLPETDKPMVLFLLSASSANYDDNEDAYAAAINWGLNGYGLMSGMGAQNPMGWHVFGGLQLNREGFKIPVQGVQDPYAMKTEGWPIKEMKAFMGDGHAVVAPDIFVRIEQLLEVHRLAQFYRQDQPKIVVAQANGIGGLQEIAGVMALKEAHYPGMENVHLIIQNRPHQTVNGVVYPHRALMDLIERRGEQDQVYQCETVREMMAIGSAITGQPLKYYPITLPQDTQFPFEPIKHQYYDWLMDPYGRFPAPPKTIRQIYEEGGYDPRLPLPVPEEHPFVLA